MDAPAVGSKTPRRASRSLRLDAAAPEPQLAPHTKRAKQHKLQTLRDARRPLATATLTTKENDASSAAAPTKIETMDPSQLGPDHDPSKKGEHLEDPMMVTMDAKARAAQEAELKAMFAGVKSARSEATEATPEAKDESGAAEAKE